MFITRSHCILKGYDTQKFTGGVPNVREECVWFVNITLTYSITAVLGPSQMLSNASDRLSMTGCVIQLRFNDVSANAAAPLT
jgi:hypothetical protein